MREVIETYILVIATVVAVSSVSLAMLPTVNDLAHSYVSLSNNLNDKVKTDFEIIFSSANDTQVTIWAKNTGDVSLSLDVINMSDVFITSSTDNYHYSFNSPEVQTSIVNGDGDSYWDKGETLMVSINTTLPQNEYSVVMILYNGVKASDVFSR
ncbi:hypothetical protein [Geoglobus acetivorans]|uniref:Uncharacterized protein n=1 Tax=Geoglobus acetivorans TaxID=565033 RepID=A0A0A7GCX1_GEOAI|nr:hypothetical protein GACE_0656 [Geoglobus acetivorans]